jgi:hypothetical protein
MISLIINESFEYIFTVTGIIYFRDMAENAKNWKNYDGQSLEVYFFRIFPSFSKLYNVQ